MLDPMLSPHWGFSYKGVQESYGHPHFWKNSLKIHLLHFSFSGEMCLVLVGHPIFSILIQTNSSLIGLFFIFLFTSLHFTHSPILRLHKLSSIFKMAFETSIIWLFPSQFSQSTLYRRNGSNACIFIAFLLAKFYFLQKSSLSLSQYMSLSLN